MSRNHKKHLSEKEIQDIVEKKDRIKLRDSIYERMEIKKELAEKEEAESAAQEVHTDHSVFNKHPPTNRGK